MANKDWLNKDEELTYDTSKEETTDEIVKQKIMDDDILTTERMRISNKLIARASKQNNKEKYQLLLELALEVMETQ